MKLYKYIIGYCLTVLMFISCDKELNVVPQDVLDADIAITSLDDLDAVLNGAYAVLREDGLYGESMSWLPDLLADNLRIGNSNGGSLRREANWQFTSGDDIDTWGDAYTLIFRANTVINNSDAFEDGGKKNRILGQALALRALAHFDLLRYYGVDYDRNSSNLGVPIVTAFEINSPERNTVAEVYDQVFADLLAARTALGNVDVDPQANGPYYFNQIAVNALLARVSLYAKQWQDAVDYATLAINSSSGLASPTAYASMWSQDAKAEVLFAVAFATPSDGRLASSLLDNTNPSAPRSTFTLTYDIANLYNPMNDIRYNLFVLINPLNPPGANDLNDDVYLPFKYPGRGGERGLNNAKVLRVSEMYLIRAEAYQNLSQETEAMANLNTLRASRITGYTNENLVGNALANAIQTERRKEFVAEGHRWFDIKRIHGSIERGPDCRGLTISCTLEAGNFRFVFPIPQSEIFANKNMVQNEGY